MCLKLFHLQSYIPLACYNDVFAIPFSELKLKGYRIILLDLDNTLLPYDQSEPTPALLEWFKQLKKDFDVVLMSNNHQDRVRFFAQAVDCPFVSSAKKPLKYGYRKALRQVASQGLPIAIGDQLMTDVLGASRMNIPSILVKPIKKRSEKWFTKINRFLERRVTNKIMKTHPEIGQMLKKWEGQ